MYRSTVLWKKKREKEKMHQAGKMQMKTKTQTRIKPSRKKRSRACSPSSPPTFLHMWFFFCFFPPQGANVDVGVGKENVARAGDDSMVQAAQEINLVHQAASLREMAEAKHWGQKVRKAESKHHDRG